MNGDRQTMAAVGALLFCVAVALHAELPASVTLEEAAAAANKWSYDFLNSKGLDIWVATRLAVLIDPAVQEAYACLSAGAPDFESFIRNLTLYGWKEMGQLQ